ncbi:LuxR family transcriptional regulator [Streptomyces sp. ODS05-4]|uniref:helix-turn-helix transcriptional regulator n=1 Tax=Streptomyces sp. ODS05-4 TaxID=2944939 RepID=UPI00210B9166|nr:LuxR family transcriptional regulator [Streptomyces sp. ODS05-4]
MKTVPLDDVLSSVKRSFSAFVSRETELCLAEEFLTDPLVNCLVVQGGTGVGKSRLAAEILDRAARLGYPTARSAATSASVPLAALAHLVPAGATSDDPVTLFQQTAEALTAAAKGADARRLVLLVDDAHLLDEASATLLRQLLAVRAVFLIATLRVSVSLEQPGTVFHADGADTCRLHLDPFAEEEVGAYLRTMLDGPVSRSTVAEFTRMSNGNILVLRELLIGALRGGGLHRISAIWHLDSRAASMPVVAEMIRTRLAGLGPAERAVVETLACCEPLDLAEIQSAVPAADCAELESEGIVQVRGTDNRAEYRLAHPVYGEVIRDQIPHARRRLIYQQQARRLKEHGTRRADRAMRIATFELAADGATDTPTLLAAVRLAHRSRDYPKIIELLDALPPAATDFDLTVMRGESYHYLGRFGDADRELARAQARAPHRDGLLSVVALRSQNAFYGKSAIGTALAVNDEAAAATDDPLTRRVLKANEAAFRLFRDPMSQVLDLLADAEAIPAPHIRHWALLQRTLALSFSGRAREACEGADSAYLRHRRRMRREGSDDRLPLVTAPAAWIAAAYLDSGRLQDSRRVAQEAYAEALQVRTPHYQTLHACQLGRWELVSGNLGAALTWYLEAAACAQSLRQPILDEQTWAGLMAVHAALGDTEQAAAAAARYDEVMAAEPERDCAIFQPLAVVGKAWVHVVQGRPRDALDELGAGAAAMRTQEQYVNESWLLMEKARLGAAADVAGRLAELADGSDNPLMRVRSAVASAMVTRQGDDLLTAVKACGDLGLHLLAAETALNASQAYMASGERKKAAHAKQVSDVYRQRCGGAQTPGLAQWPGVHPLTAREKEVAFLAAKGISSKAIAENLQLSVRTVDNFLQRVYNKTGISSRKDLARTLANLRG